MPARYPHPPPPRNRAESPSAFPAQPAVSGDNARSARSRCPASPWRGESNKCRAGPGRCRLPSLLRRPSAETAGAATEHSARASAREHAARGTIEDARHPPSRPHSTQKSAHGPPSRPPCTHEGASHRCAVRHAPSRRLHPRRSDPRAPSARLGARSAHPAHSVQTRRKRQRRGMQTQRSRPGHGSRRR